MKITSKLVFISFLILVIFISLATYASTDMEGTSQSGESITDPLSTVKVISVLAFVFGLLAVFIWMLKRFGGQAFATTGKTNSIQILENAIIAPKSRLVLARVLNKVLVLGVTEHQVSQLAELEGEDVRSLLEECRENEKEPSFKQYLRNFL